MAELCCPECGSQLLYKDGLRYLSDGGTVQRWLCRNCGFRFSEKSFKNCLTHRLSDAHQEAILMEVEKAIGEKREAGATRDVKAKLLEFAWHMKKEGMTESTISTFTCLLKRLQDYGADLYNPESVKEVLAKIPISQNSKATMKGAYSCFLNFIGKTWKPPKLQYQNKIPFIPLESEIDQLIAGCSKTISAILQLIKETGMRIGEALRLKWTDFNPANNTIILNEPEKNSNPGIYKISTKLSSMLQSLPKKNEKIFGDGKVRDKQWIFTLQRRKLAKKLGNPRLAQITFHTIRHWKGTMEYHKTHDPWHVKQLLRHKSLKSTEIYINIEQAIFNEDNSEFHVKVANSLEEACKLLEVGFEYVTDMDGKKNIQKTKMKPYLISKTQTLFLISMDNWRAIPLFLRLSHVLLRFCMLQPSPC